MVEKFDISQPQGSRLFVLDRGALHRVLRSRDLFAIGYGDVGSSIYYALGVTALYALGATPLALLLAGFAFLCTGLTYAELSAAIPEAGGSCTFAKHAFNDLVSFIAGWALLLDYIVTVTISAISVGPYLSFFWPSLKSSTVNIPFTLAVLFVLLLLNVVGIRESTRISLILTVFSVVTQLTIIGIGAAFLLNFPTLIEHLRIGVPGADWSPTWPQFWKGVGMAMVAYIGIESIAQLAGETKEPGRRVPRATLATMLTLFVMYFGIAAVALSALHPHTLGTQYLEDPMAGIVAALPVGGQLLRPWIGILGAVVLFVAANAGLIGASRLTFAMGEYYELPRWLYRLHPTFRTPYVSLTVFTLSAGVLVLVMRQLIHVADLYNFGAMLSFALAHLSLIGLRIRQPDLARPFRVPFNIRLKNWDIPLTAIVGLLATAAVWVDVVLTKPAGRNLGFLWMGVGLVLYMAYRQHQRLPASAKLEIEKVTLPPRVGVPIKKILVAVREGSPPSLVEYAVEVGKGFGASLTALCVIEIPATLPLDTFFPEHLIGADEVLERAQAIGREDDVPVTPQVLQARSAGDTIVDVARAGQFDLVIMGASLKPGRAAGMLFGSTVDYVMRFASCRVWVCKDVPPPP